MMMRVGMAVTLSGPTRSFSICEQRDSCPTSGCPFKTRRSSSRKEGYWQASWKASVGKIIWRLLRSSKSREQKKLAPSFPSAEVVSANVWAMVDFPVPARPFSQKTRWPWSLVNQSPIFLRTPSLVPSRHPCLFPQRCPAFAVWCILSRRARSADAYRPVNSREKKTSGETHNEEAVLVIYVLLPVIDISLLVGDISLLVRDVLLFVIDPLLQ